MSRKEQFSRTKSINYRCSLIAMVLSQSLIFSLDLPVLANIAAYIINTAGWIVVGAVLECVVAIHHGVDLTAARK